MTEDKNNENNNSFASSINIAEHSLDHHKKISPEFNDVHNNEQIDQKQETQGQGGEQGETQDATLHNEPNNQFVLDQSLVDQLKLKMQEEAQNRQNENNNEQDKGNDKGLNL